MTHLLSRKGPVIIYRLEGGGGGWGVYWGRESLHFLDDIRGSSYNWKPKRGITKCHMPQCIQTWWTAI